MIAIERRQGSRVGLACFRKPVGLLESPDGFGRVLGIGIGCLSDACDEAQVKEAQFERFHSFALGMKGKGFCLAGICRPQQKPCQRQTGQALDSPGHFAFFTIPQKVS